MCDAFCTCSNAQCYCPTCDHQTDAATTCLADDLVHVTGVRVSTDCHVAGQHDGVQQALVFLANARVVADFVDLDWAGDSQIRPSGFHVQLMPRL